MNKKRFLIVSESKMIDHDHCDYTVGETVVTLEEATGLEFNLYRMPNGDCAYIECSCLIEIAETKRVPTRQEQLNLTDADIDYLVTLYERGEPDYRNANQIAAREQDKRVIAAYEIINFEQQEDMI